MRPTTLTKPFLGPRLRRIGLWIGLILLLAGVRVPGVFSRGIWYDEAITLLVTAGHSSPIWPRSPTPSYVAQALFEGSPSLSQTWQELRRTDVHPPLYFWMLSWWRQSLGFSLETARIFSLLCSVSAVMVFYVLLRVGGMPCPIVATLVLGLATFSVHMGHEARAYALALVLVVSAALLAYLSADAATKHHPRAPAYALATGFCSGAALWTQYLALFPVLAILAWFLACLWPRSRWLAIIPAIVTALIGIPLLALLPMQLGARPLQEAGRPEWFEQFPLLARMNLSNFYTSMISSRLLQYASYAIVLPLVLLSVVQAVMRRHCKENRLLMLLMALATAPSIGIALLNFLSDKHLNATRYVGLALPGLAAAVSYGIVALIEKRRRSGIVLLVLLLVMQLTGVNWGLERTPGQGDTEVRSTVQAIESSADASLVVVIGAGAGRGHPGTVIYELNPRTIMAVLYGWGFSDVDKLIAQVSGYEQVCLVQSMESPSWDVEQTFLERLKADGHGEVFRRGTAVCLKRVEKEPSLVSAVFLP